MKNRKITAQFKDGKRIIADTKYKTVYTAPDGKVRETARNLSLDEAKLELDDVEARCYFEDTPCQRQNHGFTVAMNNGGSYSVLEA